MVRSLPLRGAIAAILTFAAPAAAQPPFWNPRNLLAGRQDAECPLPALFEVRDFKAWAPADGDQDKAVLDFKFADAGTELATDCHRDSASEKIVPVEGLAVRYACADKAVEFMWKKTEGANNGTLTMIETACPDQTPDPNSRREAGGTVVVDMACTRTTKDSARGEGQQCFAIVDPIKGRYYSFQPRPRPPSTTSPARRFSFI